MSKHPFPQPSPASSLRRRRRNLLLAALASVLLGGCQATFFGGLNLAQGRPPGVVRHSVVFNRPKRLALDVYAPADAHHAPVVVFFYGGSWMSGQRRWYRWLGRVLAQQGLVVVIPDYRKWPQVRMAGFMQDAAEAVAWTHAHAADYGGDAQQLFLMGHSAGAHIGALLATDERWLAGVDMHPGQLDGFIGLAGPYDFLPLTDPKFIDMFGHTPQAQRQSQPVNFVDGNEPPMLLLQGLADRVVKPQNARSLASAMQRLGEPVELKLYPGIGHAAILLALSSPFRRKAPVLQDCLAFIRAHATGQVDQVTVATRSGPLHLHVNH